jgi:hypothetical protein
LGCCQTPSWRARISSAPVADLLVKPLLLDGLDGQELVLLQG